jgi:predicted ABC-type ATPase
LPTLIIIAGPNGAGKTTFAREYLSAEERHFEFVNADEIARDLQAPSELTAARMMLTRIKKQQLTSLLRPHLRTSLTLRKLLGGEKKDSSYH